MRKNLNGLASLLIGLGLTMTSGDALASGIFFKKDRGDRRNDSAEIRSSALERKVVSSAEAMPALKLPNYRPELLEMPCQCRIIGGDTLDVSYFVPETFDSSMIGHNISVANNALKINQYLKSRPYLNMIFKACSDYRTIFPIPPEIVIVLTGQESGFDPYAISSVGAFGMNQFMRETAEDMGMRVYPPEKYPKLYKYEKEIYAVYKKYNAADKAATKNLHENNFDTAKRYELKADSLEHELKTLKVKFEEERRHVNLTKLEDDRLNPAISIDKSVKYLAFLARKAKETYHCTDDQAVDWAIEAYNQGFSRLANDKVPAETATYSRKINKAEFKLYPYY